MGKKPKIGVALGGGGAKGISHIGVIEAFIEKDIPIDYIAGTSMGSVVAAYYALNLEIKGLEGFLLGLGKKGVFKLIDFSLPKKGLISGDKLFEFLKMLVENKDFKNTKIPLKIVATDLLTGEEVILSKGPIAKAIRASISVPGIFEPASLLGRKLVDGGLVNPTPVDVVKKMGADIIIGVDHHMEPKASMKKPTIISTLLQSYEIMRKKVLLHNYERIDKNMMIIRPYTKGIMGAYDFLNKSFVKHGKKAALKSMPKIKKMINEFEG
ncbi:patatin family protein [Candidatus Woesearchaeota archaeon]|nr:patatin family protein [Candidatus Woesearchaeota archaeon]